MLKRIFFVANKKKDQTLLIISPVNNNGGWFSYSVATNNPCQVILKYL